MEKWFSIIKKNPGSIIMINNFIGNLDLILTTSLWYNVLVEVKYAHHKYSSTS